MELYICLGDKRSLISEVPVILSICKTKHFFTWCWLFLYWQSLETPTLLRAPGCKLQGELYSISPLSSGYSTHCCKSTVHLHKQLQPLGLSHAVTVSSSSPGLLDHSLVLLPLHYDENGDKTEHYLFMVSAAWNSAMGRVPGLRRKMPPKGNKQPGLHRWWKSTELMEPNVPHTYLREESFSFSGCWVVAISWRACAKGIGVLCDHERSCEGGNANYRLKPSPLGPMSADFTLHIFKIRAAILIPTRRQTAVPATVQETLFTRPLGLTFLHVFIQNSHVLEQRSVVICDVCWKPPENQLLTKFSLSFVMDYCAKGTLGQMRFAWGYDKAWSTPSWS